MRWYLALTSFALSLFFGAIGIYQLQKQSAGVGHKVDALRASALLNSEGAEQRWRNLALQAREKAVFYEEEIEREHLESGMVVNRRNNGEPEGVCDSLLFSSLRYTALVKLGWTDKAAAAWQAIARSQQGGRWIRHPLCREKVTSRDMIFGLVTALSQNPPLAGEHLKSLLGIIEKTDGSIDPGPFYVSRLSPGLGELIKQMSLIQGWQLKNLPGEVRISFSTLEFDAWLSSPGYVSHLIALMLWNELELLQQQRKIRSIAQLFEGIWPIEIAELRLQWAGQKLAEMDPSNLFFLWLKYRSAGALSDRIKGDLLEQLLAMQAFPDHHLPRNCERHADYLWQRTSREYQPQPNTPCEVTFSGVDFLWMVALLTEEAN